jgi:hypothetical protein
VTYTIHFQVPRAPSNFRVTSVSALTLAFLFTTPHPATIDIHSFTLSPLP